MGHADGGDKPRVRHVATVSEVRAHLHSRSASGSCSRCASLRGLARGTGPRVTSVSAEDSACGHAPLGRISRAARAHVHDAHDERGVVRQVVSRIDRWGRGPSGERCVCTMDMMRWGGGTGAESQLHGRVPGTRSQGLDRAIPARDRTLSAIQAEGSVALVRNAGAVWAGGAAQRAICARGWRCLLVRSLRAPADTRSERVDTHSRPPNVSAPRHPRPAFRSATSASHCRALCNHRTAGCRRADARDAATRDRGRARGERNTGRVPRRVRRSDPRPPRRFPFVRRVAHRLPTPRVLVGVDGRHGLLDPGKR